MSMLADYEADLNQLFASVVKKCNQIPDLSGGKSFPTLPQEVVGIFSLNVDALSCASTIPEGFACALAHSRRYLYTLLTTQELKMRCKLLLHRRWMMQGRW
jgi:hypothetical protein